MRRNPTHEIIFVLILSTLASIGSACGFFSLVTDSRPTPAPMTVIPSATLSPSVTPSATNTDTPTNMPTYTATPTKTDAPTPTHTSTPTVTPSPTITATADDPTPTLEIGYITPTPMRYVLQADTYFYACADTRCTRVIAPKGTVYEIWDDEVSNIGWRGVALPVTDYLYATYWMQVITSPQ